MTTIRIERRQHAVGQGGFHSGRFQIQNALGSQTQTKTSAAEEGLPAGTLNYVYDCWSEQFQALTVALGSYRRVSRGHTNILFVSQIHSAHLIGIDRLQAMAPARIVVVPYLDVIDLSMLALAETDKGHGSCALIEYVKDPIAWWRSRGANSIIFIEPDDGSLCSKDENKFDSASIEQDQVVASSLFQPELRFRTCFSPPQGIVPDNLIAASPEQQSCPEAAVLAGRNSAFYVEQRPHCNATWSAVDWSLRPYVHQPPQAVRASFRREVGIFMGFRRASLDHVRKVVINALHSSDRASQLIHRLWPIEKLNAIISMSLYSGPYVPESMKAELSSRRSWLSVQGPLQNTMYVAAGWLSTGWTNLSDDATLEPWKAHYASVAAQIGYLCLPAHGAVQNFHEDLLSFNNLVVGVIVSSSHNIENKDVRLTIEYMRCGGAKVIVVDEHWSSELTVSYINSQSQSLISDKAEPQ